MPKHVVCSTTVLSERLSKKTESVSYGQLARLFVEDEKDFAFKMFGHKTGSSDMSGYTESIAKGWVQAYVYPEAAEEDPVLRKQQETTFKKKQVKVKSDIIAKLRSFSSTTISFLATDGAAYKYDYVIATMLDDYWLGSGIAQTITIPLAPFSGDTWAAHSDKLLLARKSKLRSMPLQKSLSSYILNECKRRVPDASPKEISLTHPAVHNIFVRTSLKDQRAKRYDDESEQRRRQHPTTSTKGATSPKLSVG